MVGSKRDVLKNKSLIYVTKSSGPSIEPWGTPHFYFKIFTFNILFPVCEVTFKPIQIVSLNITELKSLLKYRGLLCQTLLINRLIYQS